MVSSDDHCQEVVGLCREKSYAGLVGGSGEYLVFQPPKYYSSAQLKLTYRVCFFFFIVHYKMLVLSYKLSKYTADALIRNGTMHSRLFVSFRV